MPIMADCHPDRCAVMRAFNGDDPRPNCEQPTRATCNECLATLWICVSCSCYFYGTGVADICSNCADGYSPRPGYWRNRGSMFGYPIKEGTGELYAKLSKVPGYDRRLAARWPLDPRVVAALTLEGPIPMTVMETVAREWPHVSMEQGMAKVAYTRDPAHIDADRQTVCRPGSYLQRVFPELTGRAVELLVNNYRPASFKLVDTMDEIIAITRAVRSGSCMGGDKFSADQHPFRAYDPALGWRMAVHYNENDEPYGRALVCELNGAKGWVRSYCAAGSDNALEEWMRDQGIGKWDGWGGCALRVIERRNGGILAPYLDGDCQSADMDGGTLVISDSADEFELTSTNGWISDHRGQVQTESGDWIDEDDAVETADDGVQYVDECIEYRGEWHYIHGNNVVEVGGGYYHDEDNQISRDYNGEWQLVDDCVVLDAGDYEGEYCLTEDAAQLENGDWVRDEEAVEVKVGQYKGEVHLKEDCTRLPNGDWVHNDDPRLIDGEFWTHEMQERYTVTLSFSDRLRADMAYRAWLKRVEVQGFAIGDRVKRIACANGGGAVTVGMLGTVIGFRDAGDDADIIVHWDGREPHAAGANNYAERLERVVDTPVPPPAVDDTIRVGDRVERVGQSNGRRVPVGSRGCVVGFNDGYAQVRWDHDTPEYYDYPQLNTVAFLRKLTPIPGTPFCVGDRVRDTTNEATGTVGAGKVNSFGTWLFTVAWDNERSPDAPPEGWGYCTGHIDRMELIPHQEVAHVR